MSRIVPVSAENPGDPPYAALLDRTWPLPPAGVRAASRANRGGLLVRLCGRCPRQAVVNALPGAQRSVDDADVLEHGVVHGADDRQAGAAAFDERVADPYPGQEHGDSLMLATVCR